MKTPLVYIDPPWTFNTFSAAGKGRSPEQHYTCMTLEMIKPLPIYEIMERRAACIMWTTPPFMAAALEVGRCWGLKFSTVLFTWAKTAKHQPPGEPTKWVMGTGYHTRANAEFALLFNAPAGGLKRVHSGVSSLIVAPRKSTAPNLMQPMTGLRSYTALRGIRPMLKSLPATCAPAGSAWAMKLMGWIFLKPSNVL
jgi:N6-adenosine-specific RNA methylase IME4